MKKLIGWINYWLVPTDATVKQRCDRMSEVGFIIGMLMIFAGVALIGFSSFVFDKMSNF